MKNSIKKVDLFSIPFSFSVGGKESKKTILGGILSLIVLSTSLSYFYYLMRMYFMNQFEPRITLRSFINDSKIEIQVIENQFIFEFLVNGEPLKQFEQRTGKTYLTYLASFDIYYQDGTWDVVEIPLKECQLEGFEGFLIFDEQVITDKNIMIDPLSMSNADYEIEIYPCDPSIESNCAEFQEIIDTIFTPYNYFQTFTKIQQYNPSSRQYDDQYRSEYMYLDPNLSIFTRFNLMKAKTNVLEGTFIQSENSKETVYNYQKIDTVFSEKHQVKRFGSIEYALIVYDLNQSQTVIVVQFPMITEAFAQFTSIFNSLLMIGFVARMLAQSSIVEQLNEVLLKQYYKKTAVKLFQKSQSKVAQSAQNDLEKKPDQIFDLQAKINEENYCKKKKKFFKLGIFDQIKISFPQLFKKEKNKKVEYEKDIYLKLKNESQAKINIFEILKDLYQLKMAIKLILTKEQFAALQFCGSEMILENPPNYQIKIRADNSNNKNKENDQEIINNEPSSCLNLEYYQTLPPLNLNTIEHCLSNQGKSKIKNKKDQSRDNQTSILKNDEFAFNEFVDNKQIQKFLPQNIYLEKKSGDVAIDMKDSLESIFSQREIKLPNKFEKEEQSDFQVIYSPTHHQNLIPSQKSFQLLFEQEQQQLKQTTFKPTQQRSHLEEMDLIEENLDVQKQYLFQFLDLMNEKQSTNIINNHIYQSLLAKDQKCIFPLEEKILLMNECSLNHKPTKDSIGFQDKISKNLNQFFNKMKMKFQKCKLIFRKHKKDQKNKMNDQ